MAEGSDDVLIKIAGDVGSATAAISEIADLLKEFLAGVMEGMQAAAAEADAAAAAGAAAGDAVKKGGDDAEKSGKKTKKFWTEYAEGAEQSQALAVAWGQTIQQIGQQIGKAIGDAAKAFPDMIAHQAELGDQLLTTSNKLGVSVEALSEFKYIAGQTGLSMEGLGRLAFDMGNVMNGTGEASEKFAKTVKGLGLNVDELKKAKPEEVVFTLTKAIKETVPAAEQSAKFIEVFGKKARGSTELLREDIDGLRENYKKFGNQIGTDFAKEGDRYNDAIHNIQQTQERFQTQIAGVVLPAINTLLEKVPEMGAVFLSAGKVIGGAFEAAWPIVQTFIGQTLATGGLPAVIKALGAMKLSLVQVGEAAWASLGPWLPLVAGIAAVAAGIYYLIGGTEGLQKIWESVAPVLETAWQLIKDLGTIALWFAELILGELVEGIKVMFAWLGEHLPKAIKTLIGWFTTLWGWLEKIPGAGLIFQAWHIALEKTVAFIKGAVEWLAKLYDYAKKFVVGFAKDAHEAAQYTRDIEAAQTGATAATDKNTAATDANAKAKKDAAAGTNELQEEIDKVNDAYAKLDDATKKQIEAAIKANLSTKQIAESLKGKLSPSLDVTQKAIDLFKDKLKEAKTAADKATKALEQTPYGKVAKEATELAKAIADATKTGTPMTAQLEAMGKKAAEVVQQASRIPGALEKVAPSVVAMGQAWTEQDLAEKVKVVTDKVDTLTDAFGAKAVAGAKAAADAVADMQEQMTADLLTGTEARIAAIEREERKALEALNAKGAAEDVAAAQEIEKINKEYDARKKIEEAHAADGKTISADRLAVIEQEKQASIAAVTNAVTVTKAGLQQQATATLDFYDQKRDIENKSTGDFEKDMALYGITTQKVAQEHLDTEQKKLAKLKALNDPYYADQIAAQQKVVDAAILAMDAIEKRMRALGLFTHQMAAETLKTEEDKLAELKARNDPFYDAQIRAQQKVVDAARAATTQFGQELKERGLKTKEQYETEAKTAQATLDFMQQNREHFTYQQIEAQKKVVDNAEVAAGKTKTDWTGSLESVTQAFTQLATISGETFGGMLKGVGEVTGGLNVMSKGFGSAMSQFKGAGGLKGIGTTFSNLMTGGEAGGKGGIMGLVGGITKGLGTIMPMAGAIIQGVTAAIAVGKKLWDAFTTSPGEKAAKQVGEKFGVKITEEAGNAIAKNAKTLFKGDLIAAEIYGMSDILKTAGGVTADNFKKMLGPMGDVFKMVEQGKFTTEQATKVLNENFGQFAKVVVDSGKVASKEFTDLIAQQVKLGTTSKEITDFVSSQTTRLASSLTTLMSPQAKQLDDYRTAADALLDKLGGLKEGTKEYAETEKALAELNEASAGWWDRAGDNMGRFERLAVAGFNSAVKAGVPYIDALNQMGPAFDSIIRQNQTLGREGGAAISELLRFREVATANKEVVESAGALNEVMLALSNTGGLNAETFKDLEDQGAETYGKLIAAGFDNNQALQQMKGYLEQVQTAHKDLGLPIDENTQALLNQAQAAGIVKGEQMSMNDVMLDGLTAIIEALGGKVPDAFRKAQDAAKKNKDEAEKAAAATTEAYTGEGGVTPAVEETNQALEDTKWQEYAERGTGAGSVTKDSLDKVKSAASNVQASLDSVDWAGWASEAVSAASEAQAAVDSVSFGSSPGGIKEIPIQLAKAAHAFQKWSDVGVASAEDVQQAIDAMAPGGMGAGVGGLTAAAGNRMAAGAPLTVNITIEGPTFWDDPNSIRPIVRAVGDSLMERLRQNRQLGL